MTGSRSLFHVVDLNYSQLKVQNVLETPDAAKWIQSASTLYVVESRWASGHRQLVVPSYRRLRQLVH